MSDDTIPEWSIGPWKSTQGEGSGGIMARHKSGKTIRVEVPWTARTFELVAALRVLADEMDRQYDPNG